MSDKLCQEAVELFRSTPVYDRLLQAVKKRYQRLGRIGGTVTLTRLTPADCEALSRFFGLNYSRHEQVKIGLQEVVKALEATRFAGLALEELLEAYFGEPLVTEAEMAEDRQESWEQFFAGLLQQFPHEACQHWLGELARRHGAGYKLVLRKFNDDPVALQKDLATVCTALSNLPVYAGKRVRLPIFAAKITTDPHGLDHWTDPGHLFQTALASVYAHPGPWNGEQQVLLYQKAGIIKGDISSYVTTYGLLAWQSARESLAVQDSQGLRSQDEQSVQNAGMLPEIQDVEEFGDLLSAKPHPLWQGALVAREVLQLTLDNLIRVERVQCHGNRVYVVENPAVFAELVEACGDQNISLICSNGQLRLAVWVLLDLLIAEGVTIFYSGDFDPEGLGIAERLIERYPENVRLWHYTVADYEKAVSAVELSELRLGKLVGVCNEQLTAVRDAMQRTRKAGYQEQLVKFMVSELLRK